MQVTVKRLDRSVSWGMIDPSTGKTASKYDNCIDKWTPGLNKITGALRTGLTATQEKELEQELGLDEGSLKKTSAYWDNFTVLIPGEGLMLDTEDAGDKLKFLALKADPEVVEGLEIAAKTARCEWVIISETNEAKARNTIRDVKVQAYAKFATITQDEVIDTLSLLGKDAFSMDPEVARDNLGKFIEDKPELFMKAVNDPNFKQKVWIKKLIAKGVVIKHGIGRGTEVPLYFGDIYLGKGLDEAIGFLGAKENSNIYIGVKKAYEAC